MVVYVVEFLSLSRKSARTPSVCLTREAADRVVAEWRQRDSDVTCIVHETAVMVA